MVLVHGNSVEFSFYRPQAQSVHLVGDFNGWQDNALPMRRGSDGYWRLAVRLPAGTFRFRYQADGEWFVDYAAFGLDPGPFGLDSMVVVPVEAHPRTSLSSA